MPRLTSINQRLFGSDSRFRLVLAAGAVMIYFGICLFVFFMAFLGRLDFESASELARTWTLCVGPIVGTVVGYYFGGSLNASKRSN